MQKTREELERAFQTAIRGALQQAGSQVIESDVRVLIDLCLMVSAVTGKEQPREWLRSVTDDLLNQMMTRMPEVKANKLLAPIYQFFLLEWCYRNSYLEDDWQWRWDGPDEGRVLYKSKIPLDQISTSA